MRNRLQRGLVARYEKRFLINLDEIVITPANRIEVLSLIQAAFDSGVPIDPVALESYYA